MKRDILDIGDPCGTKIRWIYQAEETEIRIWDSKNSFEIFLQVWAMERGWA